MRVRLLILSHLFFYPAILFGQSVYHKADSVAHAARATSIEQLHNQLTSGLTTDAEKTRSFFSWIAANIRYDVNEWRNPSSDISKQNPERVFKSKIAVCHGYASLFKLLCDMSEIKCYLVSGYLKRDGVFVSEGHTWNVVYVDQKWQQVDPTWGAGGVDYKNKFVKNFAPRYFMPDPVSFLIDHYPFDPAWQLVDHPVSLKEYRKKDWKYRPEENSITYHYNDTITQWEKSDTSLKRFHAAERMIRMNPDEIESKKEYSYALTEIAGNEMNTGNNFLRILFPSNSKGINTSNRRKDLIGKEFNAQLDSAVFHFNAADSILKNVVVYDQFDKANIRNAREAIKLNLKLIESERARHE